MTFTIAPSKDLKPTLGTYPTTSLLLGLAPTGYFIEDSSSTKDNLNLQSGKPILAYVSPVLMCGACVDFDDAVVVLHSGNRGWKWRNSATVKVRTRGSGVRFGGWWFLFRGFWLAVALVRFGDVFAA